MGDSNKEILLTEEGYKKMEAELEKLKTEERAEKEPNENSIQRICLI